MDVTKLNLDTQALLRDIVNDRIRKAEDYGVSINKNFLIHVSILSCQGEEDWWCLECPFLIDRHGNQSHECIWMTDDIHPGGNDYRGGQIEFRSLKGSYEPTEIYMEDNIQWKRSPNQIRVLDLYPEITKEVWNGIVWTK